MIYRVLCYNLDKNMTSLNWGRGVKANVEKWINIEEIIVKDNSRVQWLKLGWKKTNFLVSLKNRISQNKITSITIITGRSITGRTEIEVEIMNIYKQLLDLVPHNCLL